MFSLHLYAYLKLSIESLVFAFAKLFVNTSAAFASPTFRLKSKVECNRVMPSPAAARKIANLNKFISKVPL